MKRFEINVENNVEKPSLVRGYILDKKIMKQLKNMKAGQSFTVKTDSQKNTILLYGRKIGKLFSSRKVYEGDRKGVNAPHHFRIWCDSGKPKPLAKTNYETQKSIVKNFGSLTKGNVSEGEGDATTRHKVSNDVLAMAELRADNKRIVEDIDRIKKILKEELGHDVENYQTLNEDASK